MSNDYRTSDMGLAAYLQTAGCALVKTDINKESTRDKVKIDFVFEANDNIPRLKAAFFTKQAKVIAADYHSNLKNLKTLVHSEKEDYKRRVDASRV